MNRFNVLLVEDSPTDQKLFSLALDKQPCTLHIVSDGVKALQFMRKEAEFAGEPKPDLIVLDLNIPLKDGIEVLKEIKSEPELKATPVVVFSTSSNEKDIFKCYQNYANAFITKPLDLDRYLEVVQKSVDYWATVVASPKAN